MPPHPAPPLPLAPAAVHLCSPPQPTAAQLPRRKRSPLSKSAHTSASAGRAPQADLQSLPIAPAQHEHSRQNPAPQRQHPPRSPLLRQAAVKAPEISYRTAPVPPDASAQRPAQIRQSSPTHTAVHARSSPRCRASRRYPARASRLQAERPHLPPPVRLDRSPCSEIAKGQPSAADPAPQTVTPPACRSWLARPQTLRRHPPYSSRQSDPGDSAAAPDQTNRASLPANEPAQAPVRAAAGPP